MCGIAGIVARRGSEAAPLLSAMERMLASMRHRGPDDSGCEVLSFRDPDAGAVMGATRLAILDLSSAGHQPMLDLETGICVVLNGEISNHLEVRAQLGARAPAWKSGSDTETLLRAYSAWGIDCLEQLRGMFAFAIWDAARQEFWCARDRLGIKPLYVAEEHEHLLFASEVRALLDTGLVSHELDARGLAGYLRLGSVPEPYTLVRSIRALPAGHAVRIRGGKIDEVKRYWRVADVERPAAEATPAAIRAELDRAVREHLLSDVPVACFLSGGIDSSVVTALAARNSSRVLHTFTVGFQETSYDESEYARTVARLYRTDHHPVFLSEEAILAEVPAAVEAMDQPSGDGVNTYIVSQAVARAGIKVVLSGLGGDELFGGYSTFARVPMVDRWAKWLSLTPASWRAGVRGPRGLEITQRDLSLKQRYEIARAYWSSRDLLGFGIAERVPFEADELPPEFPYATRISALEIQGYMRNTLLRDSDVMSMASSLELRVPFLDHLLVRTCLQGRAAGAGEKGKLIAAMHDLLPQLVSRRGKHGFVVPFERWMLGPLREFAVEGMALLMESGVVSPRVPSEVLGGFERGQVSAARAWQLVVLGHWLARHRVSREASERGVAATAGAVGAAILQPSS